MTARYVFVDRDGVINDNSEYYVLDTDAFRFLPGALEALALLHRAGYRVVVISNQSAVGKGLLAESGLARIHAHMLERVRAHGGEIFDALYCVEAEGERKKPAPGMLLEAAARHGIPLAETWFIGDSLSDVEAGRRAGCRTVLVGRVPVGPDAAAPDAVAPDFLTAVRDVVLAEGEAWPG